MSQVFIRARYSRGRWFAYSPSGKLTRGHRILGLAILQARLLP